MPHSSLTLVILVSKIPSYSESSVSVADGDSLIASCSLLDVTESRLARCSDTGEVWLPDGYKVALKNLPVPHHLLSCGAWSLQYFDLKHQNVKANVLGFSEW